ncbi:MAG: hypothetical protein ACRCSG_05500 [Cellulosilyticaceae bacterium]
MGDIFKEQLVAMKMDKREKAQRAIICTVAVLVGIILFLFLGPLFAAIALLGIGWGSYFLISRLKKEHEYMLTNNELDIDVIYNKERRKKCINIDIKTIDIMASIKDEKYREQIVRVKNTIDASDGERTKNTYAIICASNGETKRVLITPNEQMLEAIYKQAPHKIMRYK